MFQSEMQELSSLEKLNGADKDYFKKLKNIKK